MDLGRVGGPTHPEGPGGRADRPAVVQEVQDGLKLLGVQRRGPASGPALGGSAVDAGADPVPDGLPLPLGQGEQHVEHELGGGAAVPGVQALGQGADVDALGVQLLDGPEPLREVTRQPVQPRDHDDVAGLERLPERRPRGPAHVPARGHVGEDAVVPEAVAGEDAALGGQPARALRLGDPDVAEDRGVHWIAS